MCDSPGCPGGFECPPMWYELAPDYEPPRLVRLPDITFNNRPSYELGIENIRLRKSFCLALLEELHGERGTFQAAGRYVPNADDARRERERLKALALREILRASLDIDRIESVMPGNVA